MKKRVLIIAALAVFLLWLNNTSLTLSRPDAAPKYLSHRGIHQTYAGDELRDETCTANPVTQITHHFIENTLPSMAKAFELGASIVELDIHLTADDQLAVFHDWTLECRTNGTGQINQADLAILQTLDVGYGYSSDGATFPLRGTGQGLIPRLSDVFDAFPDQQFLINIKSNHPRVGTALLSLLQGTQTYQDQTFGIYGGSLPTHVVTDALPELRGFDFNTVKTCLTRYAALAWSGYIPRTCHDTFLLIPLNYAPYLWGWPNRFQERMAAAGSPLVLLADYNGGRRINGIDTAYDLARVPPNFDGYIWTNDLPALTRQYLENLAPLSPTH